jgi:hypothetical protein
MISCKSNNEVKFGYLECLKLDKNEKQLTITKLHLDFYEKYLFIDSTKILLNRVLSTGVNYTYISLSPTCSADSFEIQMKKYASLQIYANKKFNTDKKKFSSFLIKHHDYFFNRIIYVEPEIKDLIVYDYVTQDSLNAVNFYNDVKKFMKKINCDE